MATLKSEIKKAISNNSKYIAKKVWKTEVSETLDGECTMWIEVSVKKRKKKLIGIPPGLCDENKSIFA